MWLNSMQREEPYLVLTCISKLMKVSESVAISIICTGAAWLSSARVVRCWVKSRNERNPCDLLPPGLPEHSNQTASINEEEGGDDVKSVWPLRPGLHTYYNAQHNEIRYREVEEIYKTGPSSDWSLQLDSMKLESLVMAHQLRRREYVPGPCTHRPSHHGSRL